MADVITIQDLVDGRLDVKGMAAFYNGAAGLKVPRRLAGDIETLDFYIEYMRGLQAVFEQESGLVEVNGVQVKPVKQALKDALDAAVVGGGGLADTAVAATAQFPTSIARTQKSKNQDIVSVKDFGAIGDGVTDDSNAILAAIISVIKAAPGAYQTIKAIYFPAGNYLVKKNNLFADYLYTDYGISNVVKTGLRMFGDGMFATSIILDTSDNVEKWLFNNNDIVDGKIKYKDTTFEDMSFTTTNTAYGNGFKQWSTGQDKRFRFNACSFNFGILLQTEGTGNADLNRFTNCSISVSQAVLVLNNHQSVANRLLNCDVFTTGDFVRIYKGGSFWMSKGNLEMHNATGAAIVDHWLFKAEPTHNMGQGNCEFNLSDVRMELQGVNKKLVSTPEDYLGQLAFSFSNVEIGTVQGGSREAVVVGIGTRVYFYNSILSSAMRFRAIGTSTVSPFGSLIEFNRCDRGVSEEPIHKRAVVEGTSSRIIANGCFKQSASVGLTRRWAEDFDFGWLNSAPNSVQPITKTMSLMVSKLSIPNSNTGIEHRTTMPVGAFIKRIYLYKKEVAGAVGTSYQLHVGYYTSREIIASTVSAPPSAAGLIDIDNVGQLKDPEISVWATSSADTSHYTTKETIIAFIEYV